MIGRNAEGQITFTADDQEEVVSALREIFQTEIGTTYKRVYYSDERGDEDLEKILRAAELVAGSPDISVNALTRALQLLIDSGEIQPKDFAPTTPLEEPEERPMDKNGRPLTEAQIRWSEYRSFAESASIAEINRRKQSDPGFASFVRKNWERQLAQPVGDAVTPLGVSSLPPHDANRELVEFVRKYHAEPIANLRPKNGMVSVGGQLMTWTIFNTLLAKATESHLI